MKKKLCILVILIAVLLVGTVGCYFMPKKFGKNVYPSEVDHINVFDGNTGTGFTITDSEDIEYIVASSPAKRSQSRARFKGRSTPGEDTSRRS